ncbi:FecR domain-containing protein [Ottowia sp. GY511]|uniref:FecR domain-containing protein n=1 Tax=Ottowia flava TaxID=2675430 RepID=A0ABW4KX63_9BURK|nr:FecR family protein [Ottowia sp. GY511]TXK24772.1 FecR domain-containing protein [Ottowia sp. GY511]
MPPRFILTARLMGCAGLLAASAVLAQTPAPAASTTQRATIAGDARHGTFKTVQGEVTVVRGNVRSAALVGGALMASDRVLTGSKSSAALTLKDGTVLAVGPESSVDLSTFDFDPTTQDGNLMVSLARGSLRMVTGLIAKIKPEHVKVTTPTTVIGVRGTDFIVEESP